MVQRLSKIMQIDLGQADFFLEEVSFVQTLEATKWNVVTSFDLCPLLRSYCATGQGRKRVFKAFRKVFMQSDLEIKKEQIQFTPIPRPILQ